MLPYIHIFDFELATYGVIIFIGIVIGSVIAMQYFSKFFNIKKKISFMLFFTV